jgi:hypothetical protein
MPQTRSRGSRSSGTGTAVGASATTRVRRLEVFEGR